MKIAFVGWLKEYRTLKTNYTTFAFIAIQLKQKVAQSYFDSLKTYYLYKKNKKLAENYNERLLKLKLLNTLSNIVTDNQKFNDNSTATLTK